MHHLTHGRYVAALSTDIDYVAQLTSQLDAYRAQCQCEPSIPAPKDDSNAHRAFAHDGHECSATREPSESALSAERQSAPEDSASSSEPESPPEGAEVLEPLPSLAYFVGPAYAAPVPQKPPATPHYAVADVRTDLHAPAYGSRPAACAHQPLLVHRGPVWHRPRHRAYCLCPTMRRDEAAHGRFGAARLAHPAAPSAHGRR